MSNFYQNVANTVASNRANSQNAAAFGNFLSTAVTSWKQNKLDDIANQLLAQQNAPKAQAVTDADGNPVIDENEFSDTTDPDQYDEAAQNASLGYTSDPGQAPNAGGVQGLLLSERVAQQKAQQGLIQARINRYNQPPRAAGGAPLGPDGLTANQRAEHAERAQRFAMAQQPKPPNPVYDTMPALSQDMQARTGHDFAEFDSTGGEDTHAEPGGVAYYMGGDDLKPKSRVFLPQDEYEKYINRFNSIKGGNPTVLNQPAIDAAKAYGSRVNGASAVTPAATTDVTQQAQAIKAQVLSGALTRDQARPLLQALGYQ